MIRRNAQPKRILAIAPSSRGFGFAVLEGQGQGRLIDWGVKSASGEKNAASLLKVQELINQYEPNIVVLENSSAPGSRRSPRIRTLTNKITALAKDRKIDVRLFSQKELRRLYPGTKHDRAKLLANHFPEELGLRLPPKRRPWTSEDYRMAIFDAVALVLVQSLKKWNKK